VTGRALSILVALTLAPGLARSDPATPDQTAEQQSTPPAGTAAPKVPPKLAERTDFQLTLTTLDALHKKGMMTDEEYAAALRQLITVGERAATSPTFVVGRFITTIYGYLEGDGIHDSQRAVNDSYGGHPVLNLGGTVPGDNGRTTFSSRGTRLGLRFSAPEVGGVRVRGNFEMDFVGNPASGNPGARPPTQTEASFFTNAIPRIRHALMQVDSDIVTFWIGQTWNVMAFEAAYLPTSVQPQGLSGQLFGRNPQIRLSHIFDAKIFSVELAAAALRPPQMDAELPDFQGGLKLSLPGWTGVQSIGSTATTISPFSVAVTGALRKLKLASNVTSSTTATSSSSVTGSAIAVDAFVPVLPAKERGGLAISVLGEATTGSGYGDLFSGLTGGAGVGQPTGTPAATYAPFQDIDAGIAGWDNFGVLRTINWRTLLLDAQISYGKVVLAGNYSNVYSDNVTLFTGANWYQQTWWDANLIVDPWPGVRFGLEYARTLQRKFGGGLANNSRLFFAGFFLF